MNSDILMIAGLILLFCLVGALTWLQWSKATPTERSELIEEAARRLVDAAEQMFPQPKAGQTKYGWVMNRLAKRFPGFDWEMLSEHVEQAVLYLNASKRARGTGLNGKHDA